MEVVVNPLTDALIVVDMQNDFADPTGALSVSGGDAIVDGINAVSESFSFRLQVATLDWHPADHCSFRTNGGTWPVHCVQGSEGAALYAGLRTSRYNVLLRKGVQQAYDSYSAFADDGGCETGLAGLLRGVGVTRVFVCGLAYDYCVFATVRDALKAGFDVVLLEDLSRSVSLETAAVVRGELALGKTILSQSTALRPQEDSSA